MILTEDTPYQHVAVTRLRDRSHLFLDYSFRFNTLDEYRYHEALVQSAMVSAPRRRDVLIFGGGDGMAAREVLRHADVERVTLVLGTDGVSVKGVAPAPTPSTSGSASASSGSSGPDVSADAANGLGCID